MGLCISRHALQEFTDVGRTPCTFQNSTGLMGLINEKGTR